MLFIFTHWSTPSVCTQASIFVLSMSSPLIHQIIMTECERSFINLRATSIQEQEQPLTAWVTPTAMCPDTQTWYSPHGLPQQSGSICIQTRNHYNIPNRWKRYAIDIRFVISNFSNQKTITHNTNNRNTYQNKNNHLPSLRFVETSHFIIDLRFVKLHKQIQTGNSV